MKKMKKITLAAGVALALTVGVSLNAKTALANPSPGYLAQPCVSGGACTGSSFPSTITYNNLSMATVNYVPNSTFGETIPTVSSIPGYTGSGSIAGIANSLTEGALTYNPSLLNLQLLNTITSNWTATNGPVTLGGQIQSNVFAVGAGATMPNAKPGELVFTYQININSENVQSSSGFYASSVAFFNLPGLSTTYALGSGILSTPIDSTLTGTPTYNLSQVLNGTVALNNPFNDSVSTLEYTAPSDSIILTYGTSGEVSPQFFVASNALYYGMGSFSAIGFGSGASESVFVPDTPEPGTLVLFGTGAALLAFVAFRKRLNFLTI